MKKYFYIILISMCMGHVISASEMKQSQEGLVVLDDQARRSQLFVYLLDPHPHRFITLVQESDAQFVFDDGETLLVKAVRLDRFPIAEHLIKHRDAVCTVQDADGNSVETVCENRIQILRNQLRSNPDQRDKFMSRMYHMVGVLQQIRMNMAIQKLNGMSIDIPAG